MSLARRWMVQTRYAKTYRLPNEPGPAMDGSDPLCEAHFASLREEGVPEGPA